MEPTTRFRSLLPAALLLLLSSAAAAAGEGPPAPVPAPAGEEVRPPALDPDSDTPDAPEDPAAAWKAILEEEKSSTLGYKERYLALKPRVEAYAARHAGTEDEVTARLWLLRNTWWHRQEGTMAKLAADLADDLLARFPKSEQLAKIPEYHYDFSAEDRVRIFGALFESSPHATVRGAALLKLALASKSPKREELLGTLAKDYSRVAYRYTTLGELAEAHLHPHAAADLEVGKKAPEIVGRDRTGKPMRLSDYEGRVVVLDFFGDW